MGIFPLAWGKLGKKEGEKMESRSVTDVIGKEEYMLAYWDRIPDMVKQQLLQSNVSVSTVGELALLASQIENMNQNMHYTPPKVF